MIGPGIKYNPDGQEHIDNMLLRLAGAKQIMEKSLDSENRMKVSMARLRAELVLSVIEDMIRMLENDDDSERLGSR